jgi:hypothetical protein
MPVVIWIGIIICIFAVTMAALPVLTLLFFSSSPGEIIIKNQLVKTVSSQLGLTTTLIIILLRIT